MKSISLYLFIIISFVGCDIRKQSIIVSKTSKSEYFFPLKKENTKEEINKKLDVSTNEWYSKHLHSLKEPILYKRINLKDEIYRYTNLGTWDNPYSIRVEKKDSMVIIIKKRTNGQGGYKSGRLIENKSKYISLNKWNRLTKEIESVDFWNIQTHKDNYIDDGTQWILEGVKEGEYHFVARNSPDSEIFSNYPIIMGEGNTFKEHKNPEIAKLCNLIEKLFDE